MSLLGLSTETLSDVVTGGVNVVGGLDAIWNKTDIESNERKIGE